MTISGSLRAQSTNKVLLCAIALLAPLDVQFTLFEELGQIPAFNPDHEVTTNEAGPVFRFRTLVRESDALIISTPEYAHGIPGSLKNALDWIVATGELYRKPVALVNASSRGLYAQAALREVLAAMDAQVVAAAEVTLELSGRSLTAAQVAADPGYADILHSSLQSLISKCRPSVL